MNRQDGSVDMTCLRSDKHRTIRIGITHVYCADCDRTWETAQPRPEFTGSIPQLDAGSFTARELRRLATYRAAVRAGFYTDLV